MTGMKRLWKQLLNQRGAANEYYLLHTGNGSFFTWVVNWLCLRLQFLFFIKGGNAMTYYGTGLVIGALVGIVALGCAFLLWKWFLK